VEAHRAAAVVRRRHAPPGCAKRGESTRAHTHKEKRKKKKHDASRGLKWGVGWQSEGVGGRREVHRELELLSSNTIPYGTEANAAGSHASLTTTYDPPRPDRQSLQCVSAFHPSHFVSHTTRFYHSYPV